MLKSILENSKINTRMYMALAIPILVLLGLAGNILYTGITDSAQMKRINELQQFSPFITNLVHEVQAERGRTVGYLSNADKSKSGALLATQRSLTNERLSKFTESAAANDWSAYGATYQGLIAKIEAKLKTIVAYRAAVDSGSETAGNAAKFYSATTAELINAVTYMTHLSNDAHLSNKITAFSSFLNIKEYSGIERAMGASGFGEGHFNEATYKKFSAMIDKQKTRMEVFLQTADPEQIAFLNQKIQSPVFAQVAAMREVAINSLFENGGDVSSVSPDQWFSIITAKINVYKEIENYLSEEIGAYAENQTAQMQNELYVIAGIILLSLIIVGVFASIISKSVVRPVDTITEYMGKLADDDLDAELDLDSKRKDEIGEMVKAMVVFKENAIQRRDNQKERHKQTEVDVKKAKVVSDLINVFRTNSTDSISTVRNASDGLEQASNGLSTSAVEMQKQSVDVMSNVDDTSVNVSSIASATEEMVASIGEISEQASRSTEMAISAKTKTKDTVGIINTLSESAKGIQQVVRLIEEIAEQTNLLALNATIEAARAGESGRGFAVVANEVKSLASQTAKATEEIAQQIETIQSDSRNASEAIDEVETLILNLSEASVSVAGAVEEQNAVMNEIATNINNASKLSAQSSDSMKIVGSSIEHTQGISSEVGDYAVDLKTQLSSLEGNIAKFLTDVQSA